jgi:DNA-binding transcriptional ArsR family regulator
MAKINLKKLAEGIVQEQVDALDESLAAIENRLQKYQDLIDTKNKLLSARRALLGGNRLTGAGGNRLTLEDVVGHLTEHPGSTPSVIAERFGVAQSTVSSHIYRNKSRFIKKDGRYWVRDPKNGLNTEDDVDD